MANVLVRGLCEECDTTVTIQPNNCTKPDYGGGRLIIGFYGKCPNCNEDTTFMVDLYANNP